MFVSNHSIPVAFFSGNVISSVDDPRLISSETGLSSEKLRTGNLADHEWKQLNVKVSSLEKAPLFIDDTPSLSIFDLRCQGQTIVIAIWDQTHCCRLFAADDNRLIQQIRKS